MTPKEKAIELIDKYSNADYTDISFSGAKQCALICCDEVLEHLQLHDIVMIDYWDRVKLELEKL
jgi:hypothetical protein